LWSRDIVIVEPSTYKIVDVLPARAESAAQRPIATDCAACPSRKSVFR